MSEETLRARAGSKAMRAFFRGVAGAGRRVPLVHPKRNGVEVLRDIPYTRSGLPEHTLDIYRPAATAKRLPILFYVHGGAFRSLSKDTHWLMGLLWARRGYLVFNVSYRLAPQHPFPAPLNDVSDALHWVCDNAERFGGDPERLVLSGESAGGNLVTSLMLATSYRRPEPYAASLYQRGIRPTAVVPCCAPLQITDLERFARMGIGGFLLDRVYDMKDYLPPNPIEHGTDLMDPLLVLERGDAPSRPLPPIYSMVGTADPIEQDTRRLEAALRRMDVPHRVQYYERETHVFHVMVFRRTARRAWRDMMSWTDAHVGL